MQHLSDPSKLITQAFVEGVPLGPGVRTPPCLAASLLSRAVLECPS